VTETPFAEVAVVHDVPVLIVDDNATNRVILEEIIRTWGMAPVTAANAREALLKLREAHTRERPVRLMLVDLNMPDADGYTLIEWVRRDELLRATIAIMLTSGSRPGDLTRSKDLQVAAHLMKPVKPSELFDAIGTSLGMLAAESHEATASSQQLPPLRVLLAEDSTVNQKLAVGLLGKHGHSVTVANHGKEAVQLWQSQAFDVVLMDVQMPEMDGFDATAVIRAQEVGTGHRIPIIAMTANAMKGDREQCLEAGMDDYISKPIRVEQLFETLSRVLRTNRGLVHSVVPAPLSDDVQYVNLSAALKSAGDDAQLFGEIARAFLEESSQLMTQISDAVRSGNSAKLTHSAHTLKGVLNTVAADGAAEIAQQVEQMGRQQDLAGAEQPLAELERLVTHIRFQLANFASETSPSRRQEFADSS
jgi:two-component system, sensor histidine kinase and response regulator